MGEFEKNITQSLGETGKKWLSKLPDIISNLAEEWSLKNIEPFNKMNWNYVATAITATHMPVVLKISPEKTPIFNEYHMLKIGNGQSFVQPYAFHETYYAMLMERAIPGLSLKEQTSLSSQEAIKIYSDLIKKIAQFNPKVTPHYPHVSEWLKSIDQLSDPRINQEWIHYAKFLKKHLLKTAQKNYLCHADLHLENIIQQGNQWLAIDPKGVYGEMAFEAAAYDLLSIEERQYLKRKTLVLERIHQLSTSLNLNVDRLMSWIFIRIMLSIQWFIEDNGNPEPMIEMAELIYSLIEIQNNLIK